jgi:hypothetical protein
MQRLLASLTIVLLLGMVITRVLLMRRSGIRAIHFGKIDKKDFLIPPFAFFYFYFYLVFAAAFGLPTVSKQQFFDFLGRRVPLRSGVVTVPAQPGLLRDWYDSGKSVHLCGRSLSLTFGSGFSISR